MVNSTVQPATLAEVTVKVIYPKKARDYKLFVLRDLDVADIQACDNFRCIIHRQFGGTIVSSDLDFDFGSFKGAKRVWIRTEQDWETVLRQLLRRQGTNTTITLWCEGKKVSPAKGS